MPCQAITGSRSQRPLLTVFSCPDVKCEEKLPPPIMRTALGEKGYKRWEELVLQVGLRSDQNV